MTTKNLPIGSAAKELHVSVSTLRRMIAQGAPVAKRGGRGRGKQALIDPKAIEAWLDSCDGEAALYAFSCRVPELLADAIAEAYKVAPNKQDVPFLLCWVWQSAVIEILDYLKTKSPEINTDPEIPESIARIRKLVSK